MIPVTRSRRQLRVLLFEKDAKTGSSPLVDALHQRGHEVVHTDSLDDAPAARGFDVVVAEEDLGPRLEGTEVLAALGVREVGVPALFISEHHDFERCRRAMHGGAVDYVVRPCEPDRLVHAVEGVASSRPLGAGASAFVRHYFPGSGAHERALRELGAHLMVNGIGPVHRVRITSGVAQLLEHLFLRRGSRPVRIESSRTGDKVTVEVAALGGMSLSEVQPALPHQADEPEPAAETPFVDHARTLAEELKLHATPTNEGATLVFVLHPVEFEEEDLNLTNADYVDPGAIDRLLAALLDDTTEQGRMIPSTMAATIGRLLAPSHRKRTADAPQRS